MVNGSKNWCFTWNNYTSMNVASLQSLEGVVQYMVFGYEIGESGTPHLQGFMQLKSRKTFQQVKGILGNQPHIEMKSRNSTAKQAADYCKKDGNFVEFGELIGQGRRTDLEKIKEQIDSGATMESLWDSNFSLMLQYRKGFAEYIDLRSSKLVREPPRVFVFYGTTGTGKTRRAHACIPESTWVYPGKGWFDGYHGQRVAIFDEFDGSCVTFAFWKQLVDRYNIRVPIKGGYVSWRPEIIIFTSNIPPTGWWRDERERLPLGHREQFDRRVERVVEMNEPWDPNTDPLLFE